MVQGSSRFPRIKSIVPSPTIFFFFFFFPSFSFLFFFNQSGCTELVETLITSVATHASMSAKPREKREKLATEHDLREQQRVSFNRADDLNMKLERDLVRINSHSTHPFVRFFSTCTLFCLGCSCMRTIVLSHRECLRSMGPFTL